MGVAPCWGTLQRLAGPLLGIEEDLARFRDLPWEAKLPWNFYKLWAHTMSPFKHHTGCMEKHSMFTTPIPMGEAQFLRGVPAYAGLRPTTAIGQITIRVSPSSGSRLRVEIMNRMWDVEVTNLVNHYEIVTGPIIGGYMVAFFLRGEKNVQLIAEQFQLLDEDIIFRVHRFQRDTSIPVTAMEQESGDGGIYVSRHTWLSMEFNDGDTYRLVQEAIRGWSSASSSDTPESGATIRKFLVSSPLQNPHVGRMSPSHDVLMTSDYSTVRQYLKTEILHVRVYAEMIKKMTKYHSDNLWLGPTYQYLPPIPRPSLFDTFAIHHFEDLGLMNKHTGWGLRNDPHYQYLKESRIHQYVHRNNGSIGERPEHLQSGPPDTEQMFTLPAPEGPRNPHYNPLIEWEPSKSRVRAANLGNPKYMKDVEGSVDLEVQSVASSSLRSKSVCSSEYKASLMGKRKVPPRCRPTPSSLPQQGRGPGGHGTSGEQETRPVYRHPAPDQSPIPRELTPQEAFYAGIGLPVPGLRPSDQMLDVLNIKNKLIDGRLNLAEALLHSSLEQGVMRHNMSIMRRELCNHQRQLTDAGIKRPNYQNNKGRRLDPAEEAKQDSAPWMATGPNSLPLGRGRGSPRAHQGNGGRPYVNEKKDNWDLPPPDYDGRKDHPDNGWEQRSSANVWNSATADPTSKPANNTETWGTHPGSPKWKTSPAASVGGQQGEASSSCNQPEQGRQRCNEESSSSRWNNHPPASTAPNPVSVVSPPSVPVRDEGKRWIEVNPPSHALDVAGNLARSAAPRLWEPNSRWDDISNQVGRELTVSGYQPLSPATITPLLSILSGHAEASSSPSPQQTASEVPPIQLTSPVVPDQLERAAEETQQEGPLTGLALVLKTAPAQE